MIPEPAHPQARWPGGDELDALIARSLDEDVGPGDLTTTATVPRDARGSAVIVAKAAGRLAGLPSLASVFTAVARRGAGGQVDVRCERRDGDRVEAGTRVAALTGSLRTLLVGERVALNLLGHLSGIATLTDRLVADVSGTGARIVDTRKTIPGLRELAKYAVRCGGGVNHRHGLYDAVLIKENHVAAAGGVPEAVRRALDAIAARGAPAPGDAPIPVQVEVTTLGEAREAVGAGARMLLLDNMSPADVRDAVAGLSRSHPEVTIEVSGGLTRANVRAYAEAGAHRLSIGALTHSAPVLDLSMRVDRTTAGSGEAG